jgi:hypothetical protein
MDLALAVLADNANVAAGDKLNVIGIFDTLGAPSFPIVHPTMALAMRFRFEYGDGPKTHKIKITLRDEDGKEYMRADGELKVPKVATGAFHHVNQIINLVNMGFSKQGIYAFHIEWDGKPVGRVNLAVVKAKVQKKK